MFRDIFNPMDWFRRHAGKHGLPEFLPYWNTVDWCPDWQRGQPPRLG